MSKKVKSIFFLYLFQLIVTACDPCVCPPSNTFERIYNGLELKAWDTSGFQTSEVSGSVNKNSFGLTMSVLFELNQIAYNKKKANNLNQSNFGFSSAYACSCVGDEYINADPIKSLEIIVTNTENQEERIVTNDFSTYGYNGEQITISELFKNRAEWHDGFQLDLTEYVNISNASIFTVNIYLESGIELTEQTEEINFEE